MKRSAALGKASPWLALVLALPAFAGDDPAISAAEQSIKQHLKEPKSAQFRNERVLPNGTVCGEVRATDSFGKHVAFQRFFVKSGGASLIVQPESPPVAREVWMSTCGSAQGAKPAAER